MDRAGITQAEMGRLVDRPKQEINRLYNGGRPLDIEWAKRLSPHVGVLWYELVDGEESYVSGLAPINTVRSQKERPRASEHWVAIRDLAPGESYITDDPDELALLGFWQGCSRTKRAAIFFDAAQVDLPSLGEP